MSTVSDCTHYVALDSLAVNGPACSLCEYSHIVMAMAAKADGRRARTVETRERIRVAAWDLFTTAGYDATTTSAIAKRAGVAAGTVFLHASDKADLLFL